MRELEGRVAVVTGGASGIGRAMAERFVRAGMKVALVDIEASTLAETAEELRAGGGEVMAARVDVSDGDAMQALASDVLDTLGGVHVVCNNAGVATTGPIWELTPEDWTFTLGANLWGVIHGVRVFAPHLIAQDEGHFVNTASMAGLVSMGRMGAYNVTKQGVVAYSETLFEDLRTAGSRVGVSVLCPAFVQSRIWDSERNRPAHLRNRASAEASSDEARGREILRQVIESSMPAERVADAVHDAILDERLYVLTHEVTAPMLQERIAHIVAGENPAPFEGDPSSLTR